eukprot:gnl/TRDRNA2_/TRDRNA2_37226_c0_seq1.p1 gnl/TRDRNA2_/TRDRNA2_37226_c0~~gnl/TRDRNA2_/TRDRNA2_37226_c0_seq1.p1  ORF type:complete len:434 (+),score=67.99 gnl/TRDRNA2_/TRDRNA2_37226_c0_seq1:43-1344(+)
MCTDFLHLHRLPVVLLLGVCLQTTCYHLQVSAEKVRRIAAFEGSEPQASGGLQGHVCALSGDNVSSTCASGLQCRCLALNRGLHACLPETWPHGAASTTMLAKLKRWERKGLRCEATPVNGAKTMEAPPLISSDKVVDPRASSSKALRSWARSAGGNFYSRYIVVHPHGGMAPATALDVGVAVLAGNDVPAKKVKQHAEALRHLLVRSLVSPNETMTKLSRAGVRLLLSGSGAHSWERHPEVHRDFTTGLGGGAPWFPSTGVHANEPINLMAEELFHTIQYVVMKPRQVCAYHNAYSHAVESGLYTTDDSGDEVDGEPVPTVQADEYFAMVMQRWLGANVGRKTEFLVSGNNALGTGREHLQRADLRGFCLMSQVLRSDDDWNPNPDRLPWRKFPNKAMDRAEVSRRCRPVIAELELGCPPADVEWPPFAKVV